MSTPKYIRNAGKHWTPQEESKLKQMARGNTPTRVSNAAAGMAASNHQRLIESGR